jgi:hypothetical protein
MSRPYSRAPSAAVTVIAVQGAARRRWWSYESRYDAHSGALQMEWVPARCLVGGSLRPAYAIELPLERAGLGETHKRCSPRFIHALGRSDLTVGAGECPSQPPFDRVTAEVIEARLKAILKEPVDDRNLI